MPKVIIIPHKTVHEVEKNKNLKEFLEESGHYIKCSCGAVGRCGDCVVKVPTGELSLTSMTFKEQQILGNVFHLTRERLSCQCQILDDVTIDLSEQNAERDDASREAKTRSIRTKVRKPEDKPAAPQPEKDEKTFKRKEDVDESWFKHWEKDSELSKKGQGGMKRPKHFNYTESEENEQEKSKPLDSKVDRPKFRR